MQANSACLLALGDQARDTNPLALSGAQKFNYLQGVAALSKELEDLLIQRFIARADVVAHQSKDGKWFPGREWNPATHKYDGVTIPWTRALLQKHLNCELTLGHYLLDQNSYVKLIAFDVDLKESGWRPTSYDELGVPQEFIEDKLREVWLDRSSNHRAWFKFKMRSLAHLIAAAIEVHLGIPSAIAYSGSKGFHVYGFLPTPILAADARIGANLVMQSLEHFECSRGTFEWTDKREKDPEFGYPQFTIEVFPKQDSITGDGFGNLMRLPLGVNLKNPNDPCFFIDMKAAMNVMQPIDPVWSLTTHSCFADN